MYLILRYFPNDIIWLEGRYLMCSVFFKNFAKIYKLHLYVCLCVYTWDYKKVVVWENEFTFKKEKYINKLVYSKLVYTICINKFKKLYSKTEWLGSHYACVTPYVRK